MSNPQNPFNFQANPNPYMQTPNPGQGAQPYQPAHNPLQNFGQPSNPAGLNNPQFGQFQAGFGNYPAYPNNQQPNPNNNPQKDQMDLNAIMAMNQAGRGMMNNYVPLEDKGNHANWEEHNPESGNANEPFNYKNPNVRLSFIRKVYLIISAQLVMTFGLVLVAFLSPEFRIFAKTNLWLMIVALVITVILLYALGCYKTVARKVPLNYVLLSIFTVCESYLVACITIQYDPMTVLIAAGLTCAIVVALTLYAMFTKTDFTVIMGIMVVCLTALCVGSIVAIFVRNKWLNLGLSILGAIIFGIYLVIDTQLVIGENSRMYSIDDYIMAAIAIYLDIINLFLEILKIVGAARGE